MSDRAKQRNALRAQVRSNAMAATVAAMVGDWIEEAACQRREREAAAKLKRMDDEDARARVMSHTDSRDRAGRRHTRQRVDGLAALLTSATPAITDAHYKAALALRDHVQAMSGRSMDYVTERVDGGSMHNGQMEAMLDLRRPVQFALQATKEAITDQRLMPGVMAVVLYGHSVSFACSMCGISNGGKGQARIKAGIFEALDMAAAKLNI